jgi:hypothetical protein
MGSEGFYHYFSISQNVSFVELLHFSLVQLTNRLLPATWGIGLCPGVQPTLWNWDYLLAPSR